MKKIKYLAILILMTIIILSTKVEASTGKINSDTVRVRKEPTTKSTILTQLDQGDEVEILEQSEGWYKVEFEEKGEKITGYISETLLDVEEPVQNNEEPTEEPEEKPIEEPVENPSEETPEENTDIPVEVPEANIEIEEEKEYTLQQEITIKILPVINSIENAKISGNIKITEIINDWCKIENDIETGWVRINQLKKSITNKENPIVEEPTEEPEDNSEEEPVKEPEETDVNSPVIKTAYVNVESLKVRKDATTESEVIDSLVLNNEVYIIEELKDWYKIKIGNKIGYVSSKYISDKKTEETTSRGNSHREGEITPPPIVNKEENNSSTGVTGEEVVTYAKQYLGYKYVSGGASPSTGFDCSGFTSYVYKHFGISLYRTSRDQIKNGKAVSKNDLQLGDLVIFNGESNKTIGHVGIYVGGNQFIHASNPKEGVKITSLSTSYYSARYVGARRVI